MTTTTTPEAVAETKGPRVWSGLGSGEIEVSKLAP